MCGVWEPLGQGQSGLQMRRACPRYVPATHIMCEMEFRTLLLFLIIVFLSPSFPPRDGGEKLLSSSTRSAASAWRPSPPSW